MSRTTHTCLWLVAILLIQIQPAHAQIGDIDGNGLINFIDIDQWNQIWRWNDWGLLPTDVCTPFLDVKLHDIVCSGDRDIIVLNLPVIGGGIGTLYGDANRDGVVNATDMNRVGTNWQGNGGWSQGDFNGDGFVDAADLNIIGLNWQRTRNDVDLDQGRCTCTHCVNDDDP